MIVKPKVRGFICTTAHPSGCKKNIENQIAYTKSKGEFNGPKKVLVIGSSTGYGLASRISLAFGAKADTLGIMFERMRLKKELQHRDFTILRHLKRLPQKMVFMQRL